MIEVLEKVADTRNKGQLVHLLAFALDEVLSYNDFNTLIERLKDDIEE